MYIKVRNYLALNFTTEDFRIQLRGPPANYVYGCHMTPVMRGALGYVSYQKGIIQGHPVHRYASRRAPPCAPGSCFDSTFTRCKHPDYFPIVHVHKIYFEGYFCFVFLVVMSNRWNQYNFSTLHRLSIWGHRWILALLLIFVDWYKHSNTNVSCSKSISNRFWCIIWRPNAIFHQNLHIT